MGLGATNRGELRTLALRNASATPWGVKSGLGNSGLDGRATRLVRFVMRYLTDGVHLYEVATERAVKNFGLVGGIVRYVVVRDCVSEDVYRIDELHLAALSEVR